MRGGHLCRLPGLYRHRLPGSLGLLGCSHLQKSTTLIRLASTEQKLSCGCQHELSARACRPASDNFTEGGHHHWLHICITVGYVQREGEVYLEPWLLSSVLHG